MRRLDLLGLLEAAYAAAPSDEEWLSRVLYAARPLLERPLAESCEDVRRAPSARRLGVVAFFYDWAAPLELRVSTPLGVGLPKGGLAALAEVNARAPGDLARALVDARPSCATLSTRLGLGARIIEHPIVREHLAPLGVRDFLAVAAACPTGQGCVIGAPLARAWRVGRAEAAAWAKVAAHVAAGLRMQRRFPFEAGPVPDVEGERAWRALASGAWPISDYFDYGGKRYVIARRGEPARRVLLSEREHRVAALAARGRSNKGIAHELGFSTSTVVLLLGSAAAKLGASGRTALVRAYVARRAEDPT
jgi:DNA-binding CsgD family transcriptional regulator